MSRRIQLDQAPDGYRGDLSCIDFITDVEIERIGGNGFPDASAVYFADGTRAGVLRTWYGNHGKGKMADQEFEAAEGISVAWADWTAAT
jgi:hypothetical protein